MSKWYYKETERDIDHVLYTVMIDAGGTHPETDSDHNRKEDAARRVAFLNGEYSYPFIDLLKESTKELIQLVDDIGGCDHSVGICCCGLNDLIERNIKAIQVSTGKSYGDICKELKDE